MDRTCKQRRSCEENGIKKVTSTQNPKETADAISRSHKRETGLGEFGTHKTY